MKIEQSQVTKIKISEVKGLDLVTVILEDLGPRQGKINIDCYGEAWSAYWGGMGDRTIAQFFCSCDEHYLAKNLSGTRETIDDLDKLSDVMRSEIIRKRRDGDIDASTARDQYDEAETVDPHSEPSLMYEILGDEWWSCIPSKPNPDYEYLCRIINAVKAALRTL